MNADKPHMTDAERLAILEAREQRVRDWVAEKTGLGGGEDPTGFLIASHEFMAAQRAALRTALEGIAAPRYGHQALIEDGAGDEAIAAYYGKTCADYQHKARVALKENP